MNRTHPQSAPRGSEGDIQELARGIGAMAGELAAETEGKRRLADELVKQLRNSGLSRGGAPVEVGGGELERRVAVRRGDRAHGVRTSAEIARSMFDWRGAVPSPQRRGRSLSPRPRVRGVAGSAI